MLIATEHSHYGLFLRHAGQLQDALRESAEWLHAAPHLFGLRFFRILTLAELGRVDESGTSPRSR